MNGTMLDWLILGVAFAGAPALALAGRWDELAAGETLPRACGSLPAAMPSAAPERSLAPVPAFLRLGRVDEAMDADRRAGRRAGMVRAAC